MEPLPSDVARLVLAYLMDTCPDVADQFLAKSPDLAEVRRMRPRAQRPFGPSLVDLLTEHATALSLVEDVTSLATLAGTSVRNGDFLCKLRQLLSLVTRTKAVSVGPADLFGVVCRLPSNLGGGGGGDGGCGDDVWQGREAATAGHWARSPAPRGAGTCDESSAVGGDCADSPVGEALQGDSINSWEDSSFDSSPLRRKSHRDSPAPLFGLDSSAQCVSDGGRQPGGGSAPLAEEPSAAATGRGNGGGDIPAGALKGTGGCAGGGGGEGAAVIGDRASDRRPELKGAGVNRRKAREPRRSSREKAAALSGTSTGARPAGWIFGQVRHHSSVGRTAGAQEDPLSAERCQPQPEQDKRDVPSSPGHYRAPGRASGEPAADPPSPAVRAGSPDSLPVCPSDLRPVSARARPPTGSAVDPAASGAPAERPLSAAAAGRVTLPVRPSARSAGCAAALTLAGGHAVRKGSLPRRRPPSQCGTVVVLPGAFPGRPLQSRLVASYGGASEPPRERRKVAEFSVKSGRDAGSFVAADRVLEARSHEELFSYGYNSMEPAAKRAKLPASPTEEDGTLQLPIGGREAADPLLPSSDSGCEAAIRSSVLPSPRANGASVRSPSQDVGSSAGSSPAASLASGTSYRTPGADGSDACSPGQGSATGGSRSPPPDGAAVDGSPPLSQSSGRSSGLSDRPGDLERSTPASQRSLRICLTPPSQEISSVKGSPQAEETPTSARQSTQRGALKRSGPGTSDRTGASSASGNVRAPRRRLLADLRLSTSLESPVLPGGFGRPLVGSTPTTSSAAARYRDVVGRAERSSPGECPGVGPRRTPRRTVRRRPDQQASADPAVAPPSSVDRSSDKSLGSTSGGRHTPSAPAKIPSDGNNALLKSINIMSFLSRIHSAGSS